MDPIPPNSADLAETTESPSSAERRAAVREHMQALIDVGNHCGACSGPCCTFRHNTMQITPLEAIDIVRHLYETGRHTEAMHSRLVASVERYDLAALPGDGRRALRKSYTCPFFTLGPRGCSIDPDHKPPGCLAFNPVRPGVTEGGDCASNLAVLERRQSTYAGFEDARNEALGFAWSKAPIPVAVLALWDHPEFEA